MKRFILLIGFVIGFMCLVYNDKLANAQSFANQSIQAQVTITSASTLVLAYDGTRIDWSIHPEGTTSIRCVSGLYNGNPPTIPPTSSVGFEMTGGGYWYSLPNSPSSASVYCASEGGSVVVDTWTDNR